MWSCCHLGTLGVKFTNFPVNRLNVGEERKSLSAGSSYQSQRWCWLYSFSSIHSAVCLHSLGNWIIYWFFFPSLPLQQIKVIALCRVALPSPMDLQSVLSSFFNFLYARRLAVMPFSPRSHALVMDGAFLLKALPFSLWLSDFEA